MKSRLSRFVFGAVVVFLFTMIGQLTANGQTREVKGTVVDISGPVEGATVIEKGTTNGTMTDGKGTFSLKVAQDATLEITCIGYKKVELPVPANGIVRIEIEEDSEELEKVVVVGYGKIRAKDFTGSVDIVKIENSPVAQSGFTNANEFLRGNVTGIEMGEVSGVGSSASIQVRGEKNLSGGGSPMLVLDGMISSLSLSDLDPETIESIAVLKDASSLAAYGSRAADGVIMVTTKRGKIGKPIISFSTTQQFNTPTYVHKYFDGAGYIRLRNARIGNFDNIDDVSFLNDIEFKNYMAGKETNWYDLATQTGYSQVYNVGLSGATERVNYNLNVSYNDLNGQIKGNNSNSMKLTSRIGAKINDYINLDVAINLNKSWSEGGTASQSAHLTPYGSAFFDNTGKMRYYVDGADNVSTNPLWNINNFYQSENESWTKNIRADFEVKAPWVKGLSYKLSFNYNNSYMNNWSFMREEYYPLMATGGNEDGYTDFSLSSANGSQSFSTSNSWTWDNVITYDKSIGKHYINASLVYTRDWSASTGFSASGSDFSDLGNTLLGIYGLADAAKYTISDRSWTEKTDVGYLARTVYSYDGRYHLNASIRRDGASPFGADKKWGWFPAFGVAWNIGNENFMSDVNFIDDLKLKASWGINGSQSISSYGTLSTVTMGKNGTPFVSINDSGSYDLIYSQYVNKIGNSELGWQATESFNAGFESALLNRKIQWELNFYKSMTTDQITSRTVPIMASGISTQMATMGRIDNWGIESSLQTTNIKRADFSWNSQVTFNLNRNKLVYLWGGDEKDDYTNGRFLGKSLDTIWDYDWDGIVQENGKGSISSWPAGYPNVIDQDGNGSLDRYDKVFLGNSKPSFTMGFSNSFNYKNLQVYLMFTGQFGGNGYCLADNTFAYNTYYGFAYANALEMNYWTPSNHSNTHPSPEYTGGTGWTVYNSYANIRLSNMNISYNISNLAKKIGVQNARITLAGQNLFYIAPNWKLSDPGARSRTSTLMRTFTLGINFSL